MAGILALLIRSLRTETRLMRSHLTKLLLLGLIYLSLLYAQTMSALFGAPGLQLFSSIAWLNLLAITIAGASAFATVITEEKEEQTLGLLRMAGISPLSLLLGKAAPRVISVLLLLTMQLPFTFLAITLGGVTSRQVIAVYILLLAHTLLMAALGLLASVVCRRSRTASWRTGIVIFLLFLVVPWISMGFSFVPRNALAPWQQQALAVLDGISHASAFWQLSTITSTGFSGSLFSYQVVTNLVAGAVLFVLAWGLFGVANRGEATSGPQRGLLLRGAGRLQRLSVGRTWRNPFVWKDFHFLAGGRMMLLVKFVLYGVASFGLAWLGMMVDGSRTLRAEQIGAGILWWMTAAVLIELAVVASRVFQEEIRWNTLTALSTLPCSRPYIWYSKLGGHMIGLAPALAWLGVGAFLAPRDFEDAAAFFLTESAGWLLVLQYLFFLHLTALLSLVLRWGAMGLSFFLVYIVSFMCGGMFFGLFFGGDDWLPGIIAAVTIAIAALHVGVGLRLRALAAR